MGRPLNKYSSDKLTRSCRHLSPESNLTPFKFQKVTTTEKSNHGNSILYPPPKATPSLWKRKKERKMEEKPMEEKLS